MIVRFMTNGEHMVNISWCHVGIDRKADDVFVLARRGAAENGTEYITRFEEITNTFGVSFTTTL